MDNLNDVRVAAVGFVAVFSLWKSLETDADMYPVFGVCSLFLLLDWFITPTIPAFYYSRDVPLAFHSYEPAEWRSIREHPKESLYHYHNTIVFASLAGETFFVRYFDRFHLLFGLASFGVALTMGLVDFDDEPYTHLPWVVFALAWVTVITTFGRYFRTIINAPFLDATMDMRYIRHSLGGRRVGDNDSFYEYMRLFAGVWTPGMDWLARRQCPLSHDVDSYRYTVIAHYNSKVLPNVPKEPTPHVLPPLDDDVTDEPTPRVFPPLGGDATYIQPDQPAPLDRTKLTTKKFIDMVHCDAQKKQQTTTIF
jgi:hypothetical protein